MIGASVFFLLIVLGSNLCSLQPNSNAQQDSPIRPERVVEKTPAKKYIVVPITGTIGLEITSQLIKDVFDRSKRSNVSHAVFVIDSPGGRLTELEDIKRVIDAEKDIAVSFYVQEEAFSAAALLVVQSQRLFVSHDARIGAAVAFSSMPGLPIEVDSKVISAVSATWCGHMKKVMKPCEPIDAMIRMESELYVNKRSAPWLIASSIQDVADKSEFVQIDSKTSILSLVGEDIVNMGLAVSVENLLSEVLQELNLEGWEVGFDGERFAAAHVKKHMAWVKEAKELETSMESKRTFLQFAPDRNAMRKTFSDLKSESLKLVELINKSRAVENVMAEKGISVEQQRQYRELISEAVKALR
jgi:membrane-bound ClpP family serine protease